MLDMENNGNITLEEMFNSFIEDAEAQNLSKRTINYYQYCYRWLKKTLPSSIILNVISKKDMNKHIRFLLQTNEATSVNSHLTGLRAIFNYANRTYGSDIKIKLIKADKEPKPTYSDEELKLLLSKPKIRNCTETEYRNWVMTNVFVGTGCRLGSCINLKVKDINFPANTIYFSKMKNRKALLLPLNRKLKSVLFEYLQNVTLKPEDYLFPSLKGPKLTDAGFSSLYRSYAENRGVFKAGIHKFRHTYAKNFILQGGNPAKLQRILGHSNIDITMNYVNLYSVDLKEDVNDFCFLK